MATKKSKEKPDENLPVSKQTAGGVAGAVVGSAIAGPVGAVVGAVAGTVMGNRAAKGKSLVPPQTVKSVKDAAVGLKSKADSVISANSPKSKRTRGSSPRSTAVSTKKAQRRTRERSQTKSKNNKGSKRTGH